MTKVRAVDSIMGSGKTTWAIQYMNEHRDERIIYCTPYVDEIERILKACPHFCEPTRDNASKSKQEDFINFLKDGRCIATTHELFKQIHVTKNMLELIRCYGYKLILDEVIDVVEKIKITERDIKILLNDSIIKCDKETQLVTWIDDSYPGILTEFKSKIKSKSVILYKDNLFLWLFPISFLKAFDEIYIMTFLFRGSYLEQYLKIHEMAYSTHHIEQGKIKNGVQDLTRAKYSIASLLTISQKESLNKVGDKRTSLSWSWWTKKSGANLRGVVFNMAYNYLHNICRAKSEEILWTIYEYPIREKSEHVYTIKGNWPKQKCPCNARATNKWGETKYLAYLINVFQDPAICQWFAENGGSVSEEQYALSQMLQWIWRSAIRNGKPVHLYIPSKRMREMLTNWLSPAFDQEAA